jgi:hypothetical protein
MLTKFAIEAIACPLCKAKKGAPCIRPSGHKAMDYHADRVNLADRIFNPPQPSKPQNFEVGGMFGEITTQKDFFK